jgi:putative oxidoreductase
MRTRFEVMVRCTLGVVFLASGVIKIVLPTAFYSGLLTYEVPFPDIFLRTVAVALPWLEVLCGALLLLDSWAETVRPLVAFLCLTFVTMIGQAVTRGLDLDCGCFGGVGPGWFSRPDVALVRALVLLAAGLFLMVSKRRGAPHLAKS